MLDEKGIIDLSEFFKLFGDPTRLKIIKLLRIGEYGVSEIADELEMSHSSISHQLSNLRSQRIVKYRREGKVIRYSLDDEHVEKILDVAIDHLNHK